MEPQKRKRIKTGGHLAWASKMQVRGDLVDSSGCNIRFCQGKRQHFLWYTSMSLIQFVCYCATTVSTNRINRNQIHIVLLHCRNYICSSRECGLMKARASVIRTSSHTCMCSTNSPFCAGDLCSRVRPASKGLT